MPRAHALSRTGTGHKVNQDSFLALDGAGLYAVSDGIGSYKAGEEAGRLVIETLAAVLANPPRQGQDPRSWIGRAVQEANLAVFRKSRSHPDCRGMGATLVLLYVAEKEYWLAGVGDSRCYRYRRGGLAQLSSDHSVAFDVYKAGGITKEELRGHPDRNLLTRTLGSADFVAADIVRGPLEDDSRLLLCSDGLTKGLRDSEISGILAACADLPSACDKLLEQALARGVKDDITLILIDPGAEAALSEPRSDAPAHSEPSTAAPKAAPKHKWKALRGLRKTFKAAIGIPLPEAMPPDEALVPLLWPSEGGPEAAVIFGTPEASDRLCLTDNELDDCPEGYFFTGFWGYGYQSNAWYYARADAVSRIWLRLPYGNAYNSSDELAVEARAIREFLPRFFDFERKIREKAKFFRASQFHGGSYRLVTRDGREAFWRGDWPKGPDFEGVYRKLFGEGDGRG